MSNKDKCLLGTKCGLAGTDRCNNMCTAFIALHGYSGKGGRVGSAELPKEYRLKLLANSPAKDEQEGIYDRLLKYVASFDRQFDKAETPKDRIKNLYLYSDETGTGKTTTASALANEWILKHFMLCARTKRKPDLNPAYFLDVNELQTLYNEFTRQGVPQDIGEQASREYYRRIRLARNAPFVVFDDIGVRTSTEGFRGDLHSLINHRVAEHKITVYTSNLPIESLMAHYDKRLWDRMRDLTIVMQFTGESKRGVRK
jgi:DNA replication protein DnaC